MAPLNIDRLLRRESMISACQRHFQVNRNQKVTFLIYVNDLIDHVSSVHIIPKEIIVSVQTVTWF